MAGAIQKLSTSDVPHLIKDTGSNVLDIRPIETYNGWTLRNEERGGHIPGARSIPLTWLNYMDWIDVLKEKKISIGNSVVVYGYKSEQANILAKRLIDLGYQKVYVYPSFLNEWVKDPARPLERLTNYQQLVYPGWVQQLIEGKKPAGFKGNNYVICHAHYGYPEDYLKGHIPGAVALDTNSLESPDTWNRRSPEVLKDTLLKLGIRYDTTVILYGRFSSPVFDKEKFPGKSAGHLGAMRCAAIMLYAGVRDVKILNGGITSWEIAGFECSKEATKPVPVDDFGGQIPSHPEHIFDMEEAKELLESKKGELVSVRSWKEFIGVYSGYHYFDRKGRIPGAVFGNCGSDAYHMENYRNFDHTMREYQEIAEKWNQSGITPDKHIAFYCGTGWRASEAFMNAYLMGWPHIAVYDGGWYEWGNEPDNPIETGISEDVTRKIER